MGQRRLPDAQAATPTARRDSPGELQTAIGLGLALFVLIAPGPLTAQAPATWADLERYQGELRAISDTVQLRRSEYALGGSGATPQSEARRLLRRGLVRIRLGEMGDGWSYGRAADDFSNAAEAEPDWVFSWYARGVALRAQADWHAANAMNLGKRVGFGSLEAAVAAFAEALRRDPTYLPAVQALYDAAIALRDTTRMATVVLPALRSALAAGATEPAVYLALTRTERLMGDPDAAVSAAREYLERGGAPPSGLRELAWSAFLAGDPAGDSAYYAGSEYDDSLGVAAYREDLALIADDSVLARFDRVSGAERTSFLRQFWTDKDRESLRGEGERLREHYRRMSYAERHYGLEVNRRHYSILSGQHSADMYRSGSMRFDDRGIVYIRYGDPSDRVLTITFGIRPNETWTYRRADGDFLLHFAANEGGDIHDLRLVPSVTDIEGVDPTNAGNPATLFAFQDRCRIYPSYCKYLNWGPLGRQKILRTEREIVHASVTWAVSTDGHELRFARPLAVTAKAFAVGRVRDRQLVHIAYQVALDRPDSMPESMAFRVPLRIRVNLADSLGHSAGWADTTTTILLPGGGGTNQVVEAVGRVVVAVPAGRWRYQMAVSYDDSTGRVLPTDTVVVGQFDGGSLAVSDLVLSRGGKGALWVPGPSDSAWFNPRITWRRRDTLAVYHEIYGLEPGTEYREELVLRRGRKAELTLGWSGVAAGGATRVVRALSLERVKPGKYVMEFVVRHPDGRSAMTRQVLIIE
jgi:tetratricopeptide (TPR) repeat protein